MFKKCIRKKFSEVFSNLQVCFFKIYVQGDKEKNCPRYFEIDKYTFGNISKVSKEKIVLCIFRFASMLFLNI